ncbi:MAG: 4a-hydroxytetrahydrobiopterin dehydratase [Endozoicomonas sp.]
MNEWSPCQFDQIEHIEKSFGFKKYSRALAFCNAVAGLAETHAHHPRMVIEWGKVTVAWGTHQSEEGCGVLGKDRFMAKQCDSLYELVNQPVG